MNGLKKIQEDKQNITQNFDYSKGAKYLPLTENLLKSAKIDSFLHKTTDSNLSIIYPYVEIKKSLNE